MTHYKYQSAATRRSDEAVAVCRRQENLGGRFLATASNLQSGVKSATPSSAPSRPVFSRRALGLKPVPPAIPASPYTRRALLVRNSRLSALEQIAALQREGLSRAAACREMGIAFVTAWRWQRALVQNGPDGLIPLRPLGRPSTLRRYLTPRVLTAVERLALSSGSPAAAWRQFAGWRSCPQPLARAIAARRTIPSLLTQAVALRRVPAHVLLGRKSASVWLKGKGGSVEI